MKWLADKNLQHIIRQWKGQGKKNGKIEQRNCNREELGKGSK